jgi:hypothetical protein
MLKPSGDIGGRYAIESMSNSIIEQLLGTDFELAQNSLDFGPHQFDGFKSGLYGGRNTTEAPAASMASTMPLTLWLDKLSMITISPGFSDGANNCVTYTRKISR